MANIHQLRSAAELDAEACDWLARLTSSTVSAEDWMRFETWRTANPRHAHAFDDASIIWRRLLDVGELSRAVSTGQTFNALTERAIRSAAQARAKKRKFTAAAAAAMGAALCLVWWASIQIPDPVFQTKIGEHSTFDLPDGSSLELNSNSRARIAYSGQVRLVKLERGEAYFDVERDPQRPFWVVAGNSWVGAVGTAFSVDMSSRGVRVTVNEGQVKVAQGVVNPTLPITESVSTRASLLKAGQQLEVNSGATEVRSLVPAQLDRSLAWREGRIYFRDERLADVVEELGRYSTRKIIFEDESLRAFTFAGTFETNAAGVEAVLTSLEEGFGLGVRRVGRTVYISKRATQKIN